VKSTTTVAQAAAMRFARSAAAEPDGGRGEALPEASSSLVEWLRQLADRDPEVGAALTIVLAAPTDQTRIELLGNILAARSDADPTLAGQLRNLADSASQAGMDLDLYEGAQQRLTAQALDIGLAWAD
jgi:hypothetical protein